MAVQKTNIEKIILRVGLRYMLGTKELKILTGKIVAGDIRLDCKKGYTCMDKELKQMFDNVKGIQRDRAIKVSSGTASLKEKKMFYSNCFISLKILLRKAFKNADIYNFLADFYTAQIREAKKENDLVLLKESKMFAKKNKNDISEIINLIEIAGKFMTIALQKCEGLFTDHEVAQIFSCSFNKVKEAREKYNILKKENKVDVGFLICAIYNFEIEKRDDLRGRRNGIEDSSSQETPVLAAMVWGKPKR